jgi:hypothetical protein
MTERHAARCYIYAHHDYVRYMLHFYYHYYHYFYVLSTIESSTAAGLALIYSS